MSGIPQPHGGALVNGHSKMDVAGMEEIKVSASIQSEIENIADGIFSPLDGFLGQADFESVISSGKLVNGTTWTIPIVLDLSSADAAKAKNAGSVLLRGPDIAAVLDVAETFAYDPAKKKMSKGVFGTDDEKHPPALQEYFLRNLSIISCVSFGRRPVSNVKNRNSGFTLVIISINTESSAPKLDAFATAGCRFSDAHLNASSAVVIFPLSSSTCICVNLFMAQVE